MDDKKETGVLRKSITSEHEKAGFVKVGWKSPPPNLTVILRAFKRAIMEGK